MRVCFEHKTTGKRGLSFALCEAHLASQKVPPGQHLVEIESAANSDCDECSPVRFKYVRRRKKKELVR